MPAPLSKDHDFVVGDPLDLEGYPAVERGQVRLRSRDQQLCPRQRTTFRRADPNGEWSRWRPLLEPPAPGAALIQVHQVQNHLVALAVQMAVEHTRAVHLQRYVAPAGPADQV